MIKADAIVVLAGNNETRVPAAASLYLQGAAAQVILTSDGVFSCWSPADNRNLYQIEWAAKGLEKRGVPLDRIVMLPFYGSSTMHDALAVKLHVDRHGGLKSLLLVTEDFHAKRALWAFRQVFSGMPVEIAVSPVKTGADVLILLKEQVKLLYYRFRFGLLKLFPASDNPLIH